MRPSVTLTTLTVQTVAGRLLLSRFWDAPKRRTPGSIHAASLFSTASRRSRGKTLTGDWFGARPHLADSGVTVDANVAQFYTGAVSGGLDSSARYAGHGDYVMNIDGDQAPGMKGMFIKLRAEHRFGQSFGGVTGALLPSAVATELPNPESEQIYLTNVLFTQMFSETFGVFAGKLR